MKTRLIWRKSWNNNDKDSFWIECTDQEVIKHILPYRSDAYFIKRIEENKGPSLIHKDKNEKELCNFFLISVDLQNIESFGWVYPYAGQWNGYNPFESIEKVDFEKLEDLKNIFEKINLSLKRKQINKRDFIIRQIARTNKKNYENYCITRIYHLLKRTDVKFVTQQYVHRPEGFALTDIYFPQLMLHVEIDEPFHKKKIEIDNKREIDIIQATEHQIERIKITEDIDLINEQIDNLVNLISEKIEKLKNNDQWEPWDLEKEFSPTYYQKKGYLDVKENPAFRRIVDACNCLGQDYKSAQKAWYKSKLYPDHYLWFPKFYENEEWDNQISPDGKKIVEKCKNKDKYEKWYKSIISNPVKRITFPRRIDNLGFKLYRFVGIFETDLEESSFENGVIHKLKETRIEINI